MFRASSRTQLPEAYPTLIGAKLLQRVSDLCCAVNSIMSQLSHMLRR